MNTVKELLIEARKLIEKPENWTQGTFARDKNQKEVGSWESGAVCFCTIGALKHAFQEGVGGDIYYEAYDALYNSIDRMNVPKYNDSHTHEEVLAMFDRAIASIKE